MRVRPHVVKLDRDLVDGIHADPARMALVESFVRFARQVSATVCAEGIESLDDVAALWTSTCSAGQGHALAQPGAPWPIASPLAAGVCRAALAQALRTAPDATRDAPGDRVLVHVTAKLAGARSRRDLEGALGSIAAELHADKVSLSRWHADSGQVETLAEDGEQPGEEYFGVSDFPLTERVLETRRAAQVMIGDPGADSAEVELLLSLGYRSSLIMPVVRRGESVGILEAFTVDERPWTRAEIDRARIISNQFASVIEAFVVVEDWATE